MLIRYPPHSNSQKRKLLSRIQRLYKMAKFDKQSLCQKKNFGMTLLYAHAHYICVVCAKYQRASVKALVQVDFLMYALSKHKHNRFLIGKMAKFTKLSLCKKLIFWHQTSSHKCSVCLYCVSKVSDCFSKSCGTSWFPRICTIYALTKCIKNYKGQ